MYASMIQKIRDKFGSTKEADELVAELQADEAAQNKQPEPQPEPQEAAPDRMAGLIEGEGDYHPPAARFVSLRAEYDANYRAKKGWA